MPNIITTPEAFGNAYWSKAQCSVTPNQDTAPDGTLTGNLITITGTGSTPFIWRAAANPVGSDNYWLSIFLKMATTGTPMDHVLVGQYNGTNDLVFLDLVTGETGTMNGNPQNIAVFQHLNGWKELSFRIPATSICVDEITLYQVGGKVVGSTILVWGGQVESGAGLVRPPYTAVSAWQSISDYSFSRSFSR